MHKPQCQMCDKERPLNDDGWCSVCVDEFEQIKNRAQWVCVTQLCNTPVTCAMKKDCCKRLPTNATETA